MLLDINYDMLSYVISAFAEVPVVRCRPLITGAIGIARYTTRVGSGPLPTELMGARAKPFERGAEYGASTGRPRRCGWFDGPATRYSALLNNLQAIALTKLDVLDEFAEIQVCTGYEYRGSRLSEFPAEIKVLEQVKPIYKAAPGWQSQTAGIRNMPTAHRAKDYLKLLRPHEWEFLSFHGPTRRHDCVPGSDREDVNNTLPLYTSCRLLERGGRRPMAAGRVSDGCPRSQVTGID
jgi:adenylosuccinate synthase